MTVHRESSVSVVLGGRSVESCGLELKNILVFQPGPMIDVVVSSGGDTNSTQCCSLESQAGMLPECTSCPGYKKGLFVSLRFCEAQDQVGCTFPFSTRQAHGSIGFWWLFGITKTTDLVMA